MQGKQLFQMYFSGDGKESKPAALNPNRSC